MKHEGSKVRHEGSKMGHERGLNFFIVLGLFLALSVGVLVARQARAQEVAPDEVQRPLAGATFTYHGIDSDYTFCTGVGAADVNGDGALDILSASEEGSGLIHAWQNIDGTFVRSTVDAAFRGASVLYASDWDEDGDVDLSAASLRYAQFARYENQGGSWQKTDYTPFTPPAAFSVRGVERAGQSYELLATTKAANEYYGIRLGPGFLVASPAETISALYPENIDRRGTTDIVAAARDSDLLVWYEDLSDTRNTIDAAFGRPIWVQAGDLDQDGDADVVAASDSQGLYWWENTDGRGGAWTKRRIAQAFYHSSSLHLVDLDHDGDLDLTAATRHEMLWWENLGAPTRAANWVRHLIDVNPSAQAWSYALLPADVDGDGQMDIIGCDLRGSQSGQRRRLGWWENTRETPTPEFMGWDISDTLVGAWGVDVADFDGDGRRDVAAAGYGNTDATGVTGWWRSTPGTPTRWTQVFSATFDKGRGVTASSSSYLVSGNAYSGETREFGSQDWGWTHPMQQTMLSGLGDTYVSAVADLNDDGIRDVLGASAQNDDVVWARSNNDGSGWGQLTIDADCAGARGVCTGDFDGDGDLDVAAACQDEARIHWWQNDNDGASWTAKTVPVGLAGATDVKCGDINGDGEDEMVAAASDVVWFKPNATIGDGATMGWVTDKFTGTAFITLHDADRDGDLDVLATSYSRDELAWLENTGTGSYLDDFAVHTLDEFVGGVREVAAGDLNGDGAPDLVVAAQDAGRVRWYEQRVATELSIENQLDPAQSTDVISTGQSISYLIEVTNNSYSGVTADVLVVDRWAPSDAIVDASSDQDCVTDLNHGVMTCTLSLQAGRIKQMRVVITPGLLFDGTITNTAQVVPVSPFWNTTTYLDTATAAPVEVQKDLTIWDGLVRPGAFPKASLAPGSTFTYTIGVLNMGPKSSANATMINAWSPTRAIAGIAVLGETLAPSLFATQADYDCVVDTDPWEIYCDLDLTAGVPLTLTIAVTTSSRFTEVLETDLALTGPDGDESNPTNNQTWPLRVGARPLNKLYLPLLLRGP